MIPLLVGTMTFVVLIVGHLLFQVIQPVVERGVPLSVVLQFVLLQVPNAAALALPVSMLLAAALSVHRMARDNELVAVRAAGASIKRLLAPIWAVGVLTSGASFLVAEYVQPRADRRAEGIITSVLMAQKTLALQPGKFAQITPEVHILPGNVDDRTGELSELKVFHLEPKGIVTLMQAQSARVEGERLVLERPMVVRIDERGALTRCAPSAGSRAVIHIPRAIKYWTGEQRTLRNMSVRELLHQIRRETEPAAAQPLLLELHGRLSLAAACLALAMIGGPLTLVFREGRSLGGPLSSIFFAFLYYIGMLWTRMLGGSGTLAPAVAGWLPIGVTAALAIALLWRRA